MQENIYVMNNKNTLYKNRMFFSANKIKNRKHISIKNGKVIFFIIETNSYQKTKQTIKKLKKLNFQTERLVVILDERKSEIYLNDIKKALKVLSFSAKKDRYEYIYDTVCEFLDNEFKNKNFCDFKDNKCIANREGNTERPIMGCCYSFEYAGFFSTQFIKNVKLCEKNNCEKCKTKCISCKLFTCNYLKKRNIKFEINKILLLDCFFNNKQKLILKYNFFKNREEIIDKLLEKNSVPLIIYYARNKYRI